MVPAVKGPPPAPTARTGAVSPGVLARGPDFGALPEHRPVEAGRSAPAAGARVGAGELVDVGAGDRSRGRAHRRERELSQELALAAGEQHFRDAGRGENADTPAAPWATSASISRPNPGR